MKLSETALTVLKNFSSINSGVVLQEGNIQKTISPEKSILVEAELEDSFPVQFGIYDLNTFLGNITTLSSTDVEFTYSTATMSDGQVKFDFYPCAASLIVSPPNKSLVMKQVDISFSLAHASLQKLLKLASMNSLPNLSVIGKNGEIRLETHEKSNDTSNVASIKLNDYDGEDFVVSFKVENIKLIPDDYDVEIMIGGFAKFTAKNKKLKYWIAVETK